MKATPKGKLFYLILTYKTRLISIIDKEIKYMNENGEDKLSALHRDPSKQTEPPRKQAKVPSKCHGYIDVEKFEHCDSDADERLWAVNEKGERVGFCSSVHIVRFLIKQFARGSSGQKRKSSEN